MRGFAVRATVASAATAGLMGLLVLVPAAQAGLNGCSDVFSFSAASYAVNGGQAVTITVQDQRSVVNAPSCSTASVDYATSNGTATSPADYQSTSGTLTFGPGSTAGTSTQTFSVPTVKTAKSGDTNFSVTLSNPTAGNVGSFATLGSPSTATVTIHNSAQRPAATTGGAQNITRTGATISGKVNPHGVKTTYYFQFGRTRSYGSRTSSKGAGSGSQARRFTASLKHLRPHTTYHYRIVAVSAAGTAYGSDHTFTTKRAAAKPAFTG